MTKRFLLLLIGFAATAHSFAEPPPGPKLNGRVVDASKGPIVGAQITASSTTGETSVKATSNQSGEFSLSLTSGSYNVRIAASGFVDLSQTIDTERLPTTTQDFVLEISRRSDSVTVTDQLGYDVEATSTATKTPTLVLDIPQSISLISSELIRDQAMLSMADVVRYIPGITSAQGEGNRDQLVIRGNNTSANFFVDGIRDDVQYYRDLYNVDRVEVLKGADAMIFGRGAGGGVVNRVIKSASATPVRELTFEGGSFDQRRATADFDQPLSSAFDFRLNGMYENSGSFRDHVTLERYGINPTLAINLLPRTPIKLSYEYFRDRRVADRGVPSFLGRPVDSDISTFFGNPYNSHVDASVQSFDASVDHEFTAGRLLRDQIRFADYHKFYQNSFAGAVSPDGLSDTLSAYNHRLPRRNFFNQTDYIQLLSTGRKKHTILIGSEQGRQNSDQFRNTGYFNGSLSSLVVPLQNPTITTPLTFSQAPSDANNYTHTNLAAVYIQDQVQLSKHFLALAGIRYDLFDLTYHDNRSGSTLGRTDNLASPRAGIVYKPIDTVSLYASYGVSYLPSSGDQFLTLTITSQNLKPEKFSNYEAGAKWDFNRRLSLSTAWYRLDRTNTAAPDPADPTRTVLTGSQRTSGYEFSFNGKLTSAWQTVGGYGYQNAYITSTTSAAQAGARVPLVPRNTASLWNNYRILPRWGVGLGLVNQASMFAAIDDSVLLPTYTRVDAATYITLTEYLRFQANIENLLDKTYYPTANSNNNISPGAPRSFRLSLTARF